MNTALPIHIRSLSTPSTGDCGSFLVCATFACLGVVALLAMAVLPVVELALRTMFSVGVPGSSAYVQNLSLWIGFTGTVIAAHQGTHLKFATGNLSDRLPPPAAQIAGIAIAAVVIFVAIVLARAALEFVGIEMDSPVRLGGWLPNWIVIAVMPIAFLAIAFHAAATTGTLMGRGSAVALAAALIVGFSLLDGTSSFATWFAAGGLLVVALAGAPIFIVLGGLALTLFAAHDVPVSAIPVEAYRIVVSPAIPTIPLFVLTGYLLAHGHAGDRLVRLFQALFGWLPGGLAIVVTLVSAFFSTFTGASGITIVALGGLLYPVLRTAGYRERYALGLVTASGSIGLLFPPSLAVILYGIVAHIPIPDLFRAGAGPGLVMLAAVCALGVVAGLRTKQTRQTFAPGEAIRAIWQSKWEIGLPVVALFGIFGGVSTLTEAAAMTAVYAFAVQAFVHRDLDLRCDLVPLLIQCVSLVGAIFAIVAVAMGLTNFFVDAEIPARAATFVEQHIESRFAFLLALNLFLLVVGAIMDIYAATVVVVPLLVPLGAAFGIHPLHLAMIFLVNLELGYLTPPVGMNLFLAAIRFELPILKVCRSVLPFLATLLTVVLLVTYWPQLSLAFIGG